MGLIYLIQVHKNPQQVNKLIAQIVGEHCTIYVNVDQKSAFDIEKLDKRARLIADAGAVQWGDISQVTTTLKALAEIENRSSDYSHVIFLSGQDFPTRSNADILETIKSDTDYMRWEEISDSAWNVQSRYEGFRYNGGNRAVKLGFKAVNKIYRKLGQRRKPPYNLKAYGGSSWWILSRSTIQHLLHYIATHKRILPFFRYTTCPDEMFFQTILCNAALSSRQVNDNLRYIKFFPNRSNPETLDASYYDAIVDSRCLFCRKIESPQSDELVSMLLARRNDTAPLAPMEMQT